MKLVSSILFSWLWATYWASAEWYLVSSGSSGGKRFLLEELETCSLSMSGEEPQPLTGHLAHKATHTLTPTEMVHQGSLWGCLLS